ncbi:MAG TPA: hypothetical protein VF703_15300 [Pyrinomonadaceae bacterium]|jgi:hypothetical protein
MIRGDTINAALGLIKKDVLDEDISRRSVLTYIALGGLFLVLTAMFPRSGWLASPVTNISAGSLLLSTFAAFSIFFIPFVCYMFLIQGERRVGSFVLLRVIPLDLRVLFWSRVASCWLLTMFPVAMLYLIFTALYAAGLFPPDLLTPLLFSVRFPLFIAASAILTSTVAVGLALNISPQLLPFITMLCGSLIVLFPFFFSPRLAGTDSSRLVLTLLQRYGGFFSTIIFLLFCSLCCGLIFSWLFRHKRSYV